MALLILEQLYHTIWEVMPGRRYRLSLVSGAPEENEKKKKEKESRARNAETLMSTGVLLESKDRDFRMKS